MIVRIDSPGGDAYASDDIWREMNLLSKKKPLVISMSDAAASGGYYMAMTGDPILAYAGHLHGLDRRGVRQAQPARALRQAGHHPGPLRRGRFADIDSEYQPLSPDARRKLREGIDESYHDFVAKVAEARKRPFSEVEPLAQGRVWLGDQARQRGLVDELGGIDRAIERVKERAKIGKEEKVTLVNYPPKRTIFDVAFGRTPESVFESHVGKFLKIPQIRSLIKGGLLRVMPYTVEVK